MLRVGSNNAARRFRSCIDNARGAGKNGWLGIRAGSSDQRGKFGNSVFGKSLVGAAMRRIFALQFY